MLLSLSVKVRGGERRPGLTAGLMPPDCLAELLLLLPGHCLPSLPPSQLPTQLFIGLNIIALPDNYNLESLETHWETLITWSPSTIAMSSNSESQSLWPHLTTE